jgi:hypothetical protein
MEILIWFISPPSEGRKWSNYRINETPDFAPGFCLKHQVNELIKMMGVANGKSGGRATHSPLLCAQGEIRSTNSQIPMRQPAAFTWA